MFHNQKASRGHVTVRRKKKSKKLKLDGLLSKKLIPSAKILYTEDLSNITFNYLCEKLTKLLMLFLCHFSQHNPSESSELKHYILSTKVSHESADFQTFHCSH